MPGPWPCGTQAMLGAAAFSIHGPRSVNAGVVRMAGLWTCRAGRRCKQKGPREWPFSRSRIGRSKREAILHADRQDGQLVDAVRVDRLVLCPNAELADVVARAETPDQVFAVFVRVRATDLG